MLEASIRFSNRDGFYDKQGYEKIFRIVAEFKRHFDFTIHSFGEYEKIISFNLKGDYHLAFDLKNDTYYTKIYCSKNNIDDFKEKYEFLNELIKEVFLNKWEEVEG